MSQQKKSFILYIDSLDVIDDLTDEQAGQLFRAIKSYHVGGDFEPSAIIKVAFSAFKSQFNRDLEKYKKIVNRNKNNGLKGGRPKTQTNPEEPTGLSGNPEEPKKPDSGSGSESGSESGSSKEGPEESVCPPKKSSRFTPPTIDEVRSYCQERGNTVNPQKFIDHYEANGWMRGKNKIKSWKACVRTWEDDDPKPKPPYGGLNAI